MSIGPVGPDAVPRPPYARTAQRLTWPHLPREIRAAIEERTGPVLDARSCDSGYTPGFASVLTSESGSVFVKAASRRAQAPFAEAYAAEARMHRALGRDIPAPELLWALDGEWLVLGFEAIDAATPRRPWSAEDLDRALALAETVAGATNPIPEHVTLDPITEDLPDFVIGWESVPTAWPHHEEAAALARLFGELTMERFAHADLRDDNILLARDGRTLACDWNWPALAPVWFDTLGLLVTAYGDGHDADALLARHPLTAGVEAEQIDAGIASIAGYMLAARERPVPPSSPYLRVHGSWWAEASWAWLAARRGW